MPAARHGTPSPSPLPNRVREALQRAKKAAAQFRTEVQPLLTAKEQELNLALQRLAEAERAQVQLERDIQSTRQQRHSRCATKRRSSNIKPLPASTVEDSSSPLTVHPGSVNLLIFSQTSSFGMHDVIDAPTTHGLGTLYGQDVLPLDLTTATECGQQSYSGYLRASAERPPDQDPPPASTFVTVPAHRTPILDATLDEPLSADLFRGSPLLPPLQEMPPRLRLESISHSAASAMAVSPEDDLIVFDSATANSSSDLADDAHLEPSHSSFHGIDGIGTDSPVVSNSSEDSLTPSLKLELDYGYLPETSAQHALLDSDIPRSLPCALLDHPDDSDQPCNSSHSAETREIHLSHVLLTPTSEIEKDYSASSVASTHRLEACSSTSTSAQSTLRERKFGLGLGFLHAESNPRYGDALLSRYPLAQDAPGLVVCRKIRHPRTSDVYPPIRPPGGR